jgi:eukaryotic-like serine/threonine-protein kinase
VPSSLALGIPPALEQVVLGCLAKDPAQRPSNIGAFVRALAPFATPRSRSSLERINRIQPDGHMPLPALNAPPSAPALAAAPIQTRTLLTDPHIRPDAAMAASPSHAALAHPTAQAATMPNWAAGSQSSAAQAAPRKSRAGLAIGGVAIVLLLAVGAFGAFRAFGPRAHVTTTASASVSGATSATASSESSANVVASVAPATSESAPHEEAADAGAPANEAKATTPAATPAKPKSTPKGPTPAVPNNASPTVSPTATTTATTRDLGGSRR